MKSLLVFIFLFTILGNNLKEQITSDYSCDRFDIELRESDIPEWNSKLNLLKLTVNDDEVDFEDLPYLIKRCVIKNEDRPEVTVSIDGHLPYFVAFYLEVQLAKAWLGNFNYLSEGDKFKRRVYKGCFVVPCSEMLCGGDCIKKSVLSLHRVSGGFHKLKPYYNPSINFCSSSPDQFYNILVDKNELYVNDSQMNIEDLSQDLKNYMSTAQKYSPVVIQTPPFVEFSRYAEVNLIVKKTTHEIKDSLSLILFNKEFIKLTNEELRELNSKYQKQIPSISPIIRI